MYRFLFRFSVVLVFIINSLFCFADTYNLDDLQNGVMTRIKQYDCLEFLIDSKLYHRDFDIPNHPGSNISMPLCKEVVRIHVPPKGPPWTYWIQEIQDDFDKQWIINEFKVTNVLETRNFQYAEERSGQRSSGSIVPWLEWDEDAGRSFFTFSSIDTFGLSLFDRQLDNTLKHSKNVVGENKLQFVNESLLDGEKILIFRSARKDSSVKIHITYPHCLIVYFEWQYKNAGQFGGRFKNVGQNAGRRFSVDKIGFFEGIAYPLKGTFHQEPNIMRNHKTDYQFEVTAVKRFDKDLLKHWFPPEFPPNTSVHDVSTDKVTRIPPSERQIKKIAEYMMGHDADLPRPKRGWINIVLMVCGSVLIVFSLSLMIWKRYKK